MAGSCRAGRGLVSEILLRTAILSEAPTSSGGIVISLLATCKVTNRKRLTATLQTVRNDRRLLRNAFLTMKLPSDIRGRPFRPTALLIQQESAFLKVERPSASAGGAGIVGDHDHGLCQHDGSMRARF